MCSSDLILAGDIGGTKTILAIFSASQGLDHPILEKQFASNEYSSFDEILDRFLQLSYKTPDAAAFGVAGRVAENMCRPTNLEWHIHANRIRKKFQIKKVFLLNDMQATALAVPYIQPDGLLQLNPGIPQPDGTIAVIAPGTGLGESFLIWKDNRCEAYPTEGGHASFSPVNREQRLLLEYLHDRMVYVSFETVCSGSGVPHLYSYLAETGRYENPNWLCEQLAVSNDPAAVLLQNGYAGEPAICVAVLDLFIQILGNFIGNAALQFLPTGGVFLGGGIPPKIAQRLQQPDFCLAIRGKGRFREWLSQIPVAVILNSKSALIGAARYAKDRLKKSSES